MGPRRGSPNPRWQGLQAIAILTIALIGFTVFVLFGGRGAPQHEERDAALTVAKLEAKSAS